MNSPAAKSSIYKSWTSIDTCPYCGEKASMANRACAACGRDLDLVRELRKALDESLPEKQTQEPTPPHVAESLSQTLGRSVTKCGAALLALLVADVVIIFLFDARLAYLLAAAFAIPAAFGFQMGIRAADRRAMFIALGSGTITALLAVVFLSFPPLIVDHAPILPRNAREWREAGQFFVIIALAFATGTFFGRAARNPPPQTSDAPGQAFVLDLNRLRYSWRGILSFASTLVAIFHRLFPTAI